MTTAVLNLTFLASRRSLATGRDVVFPRAQCAFRAPRWSSNMTGFSPARRWRSTGAGKGPGSGSGSAYDSSAANMRPTTSSSGNPSAFASSTTKSTAAESVATKAGEAAKTTSESGQHETMDWNSYFALRKTRRNYERVFMAPCALVGLFGAGYYFAQKDFDPTPIFGMDQVIVYIAGTVAAGIVGLAVGPVVGNMAFRTTHSKAKPLVDMMDREFHKHIVKNRADPTANSVRNPVPDYYGEKIKSVSEYRKWLRKQREYRRKATFFVGVD